MIVSDHGMAPTGLNSGVVYLQMEDYLNLDDVSIIIGSRVSAVAEVFPYPGKTDKVTHNIGSTLNTIVYWFGMVQILQVYQQLKQMPGVDVYLRDDIPAELNFKKSHYLQDILIVAKPGKSFPFVLDQLNRSIIISFIIMEIEPNLITEM